MSSAPERDSMIKEDRVKCRLRPDEWVKRHYPTRVAYEPNLGLSIAAR